MTPADEQAFTAFVNERGPALLRYARMLVPRDAEAEDVLQTALIRLTRHWSKNLGAPDAYVRQAVLNVVRDRARRRHLVPTPATVTTETLGAHPDHAEALEARTRLDELLSLLPVRQRAAVVLRVLEGLSESETAEAMACSPGTVKSNLSRGLGKLRAAISGTTDAAIDEGAQR